MPNSILKNEGFQITRIMKNRKIEAWIFFHILRYFTIHDWLLGYLKCCVIRNHAYQRKQKNSKISKICNNSGGAVKRCHRLMGSNGSGQKRSIWWNQIRVSMSKWVSIPRAMPLPIDFNKSLGSYLIDKVSGINVRLFILEIFAVKAPESTREDMQRSR